MEMEKLLFMGCSFGTEEALRYARSIGIHTIVTDYFSPEISRPKMMADEYWMIDLADLDYLEQKCRLENITSIFAATSEFCLDQARELCRRLDLPFYASDEGWLCSRDKKKFKQYCTECGLDTPHTWLTGGQLTRNILEHIEYPVIVKPTDSCAQQGISVCKNEQELLRGFEAAQRCSSSGQVLVEEYIVGEEVAHFYFFLDGEAVLSELDDLVYLPIHGRSNFVFVKNYSRFSDTYLREIHPRVKRLFERMKCRHGTAFLQGIWRGEKLYFLEMGYRLDGIGVWKRTKKAYGYSSLEFMVDCALREPQKELPSAFTFSEGFHPDSKITGTYLMWARPGKVAQIDGLDAVSEVEGAEVILQHFQAGDTIPDQVSLRQIAFYIAIVAESTADMKKKVKIINEVLHMYNEEGCEMLFYLTDYDSL